MCTYIYIYIYIHTYLFRCENTRSITFINSPSAGGLHLPSEQSVDDEECAMLCLNRIQDIYTMHPHLAHVQRHQNSLAPWLVPLRLDRQLLQEIVCFGNDALDLFHVQTALCNFCLAQLGHRLHRCLQLGSVLCKGFRSCIFYITYYILRITYYVIHYILLYILCNLYYILKIIY